MYFSGGVELTNIQVTNSPLLLKDFDFRGNLNNLAAVINKNKIEFGNDPVVILPQAALLLENNEIQEILDRLKRHYYGNNEVPAKMLSGRDRDKLDYKVRQHWWTAIKSDLANLVSEGMIRGGALKNKINDFLDKFGSEEFVKRLTRKEDIDEADALISEVLSYVGQPVNQNSAAERASSSPISGERVLSDSEGSGRQTAASPLQINPRILKNSTLLRIFSEYGEAFLEKFRIIQELATKDNEIGAIVIDIDTEFNNEDAIIKAAEKKVLEPFKRERPNKGETLKEFLGLPTPKGNSDYCPLHFISFVLIRVVYDNDTGKKEDLKRHFREAYLLLKAVEIIDRREQVGRGSSLDQGKGVPLKAGSPVAGVTTFSENWASEIENIFTSWELNDSGWLGPLQETVEKEFNNGKRLFKLTAVNGNIRITGEKGEIYGTAKYVKELLPKEQLKKLKDIDSNDYIYLTVINSNIKKNLEGFSQVDSYTYRVVIVKKSALDKALSIVFRDIPEGNGDILFLNEFTVQALMDVSLKRYKPFIKIDQLALFADLKGKGLVSAAYVKFAEYLSRYFGGGNIRGQFVSEEALRIFKKYFENAKSTRADLKDAKLEYGKPITWLADIPVPDKKEGGIDLSQIELTLKDEKFASSLNPADLKILRAAKYLKEWPSLSLLYAHEALLMIQDNLVHGLKQKTLLQNLLAQLQIGN